MGTIVGVVVGFLLIIVAIVLLSVRRRQRRQKNKEKKADEEHVVRDLEADIIIERNGHDSNDPDYDRESSNVAVEVVGGSAVYSPKRTKPKKKKKKSKPPSTPSTLESIEESEDMDEKDKGANEDVSVVLLGEEDEYSLADGSILSGSDGCAQNLNDKFEYVAEVQTKEDTSPERNKGSTAANAQVSTGSVGAASGGTHLELAVGNNNNAIRPISPPLRPTSPQNSQDSSNLKETTAEMSGFDGEEKKMEEESKKTGPGLSSPVPAAYSPRSMQSPSSSSTGSSLYLDEKSLDSKERLKQASRSVSPLSPDLIGFHRVQSDDLPEDEKRASASHTMLQPRLEHKPIKQEYNLRPRMEEPAPEDELVAPGAHYIAKSNEGIIRTEIDAPDSPKAPESPTSNKFGKSVRQKRTSGGFRPTSRGSNSRYQEFGSSSESESSPERRNGRAPARVAPPPTPLKLQENARPSFKRRSKRGEELFPKEERKKKQADAWNDFLKELESAEKQFFSPKESRAKSLLSYSDSSVDESTESEDALLETPSAAATTPDSPRRHDGSLYTA